MGTVLRGEQQGDHVVQRQSGTLTLGGGGATVPTELNGNCSEADSVPSRWRWFTAR